MQDFKSIKVTQGVKALEIDNPTSYPLINMDSKGAVFKLSDGVCVKIFANESQAELEAKALTAGQRLPFFPKVVKIGPNFIMMEYINAPTLKKYLKNCTYIPESLTKSILTMINQLRKAKYDMVNLSLETVFVLEDEELKTIDWIQDSPNTPPVPFNLLRDFNEILLKDSFLAQVRKLEPDTYEKWMKLLSDNRLNYGHLLTTSGESDRELIIEGFENQDLIGKGHQGAVYRIAEDKCVKVYQRLKHCMKEKKVLLSNQHLSFIPKVYETGPNYIVMEYLQGPDLNSYLKKQTKLSAEITRRLLDILSAMKKSGFRKIDAPLRHIILSSNRFKVVDHVYSFSHEQERPLELFRNLYERNFLEAFLDQVERIDPNTYYEWAKSPIPLSKEAVEKEKGMRKIEKDKRK